jgi:amidohydrolase
MRPNELTQVIQQRSIALAAETIAHRRYIHQNPELSFQEYNTANYVENELRKIGFKDLKRLSNTGVIALLKPAIANQLVVALRADLDALPIQEKNEIDYKSANQGIMHACGHDVHTAILLTAAKILFEIKDNINGNIKFIFQPGEEKLPGGASLLINEAVLENPKVNCIIAQHVTPQIPVGKIGFKSGLFMASTDEIYVTIIGRGGHAAMPDLYNNPLLIAATLLLKLNQFFMEQKSENLDQVPTVLAFGKIQGLGATNVIPQEVKLEGTFRTLQENWRATAHHWIKKIAEQVAISNNATIEVTIAKGYPCLVNNEKLTEELIETTGNYIGHANVTPLNYRMTAEDFAYYSQEIPACFYRLGTGNVQMGITANVHEATFNIDESVLHFAPGVMVCNALSQFN